VADILKPFLAGLVTFLALDLLWIGVVANAFYKRELAGLARMSGDAFDIRIAPALVLYPMIIVGLQLFALPRAAGGPVWQAAAWGGLFGLIGYGVYDLTNYATLTSYTWRMTVVDMCWGMTLSAATAAAMAAVAPAWGRSLHGPGGAQRALAQHPPRRRAGRGGQAESADGVPFDVLDGLVDRIGDQHQVEVAGRNRPRLHHRP
jgi:uncharacterized membrane protein